MTNVLLGTVIGDALGVPFETKSPNYPLLVNWDNKTFLGSQHHNLLPGQYSDDGQMSIMVAESLIQNKGFSPKDLSERYVDWIVSKRARGYGKTTLMAISNLIKGVHWTKSGVPESYGNGTAMRAAPFGVFFRDNLKELIAAVKTDSAITHASNEAEAGALAIALAIYFILDQQGEILSKITPHLPVSKVKSQLRKLSSLVNSTFISPTLALRVLGTKADVRETVPAALYCFLRFKDYHSAIVAAIRAGGDTDTTAAITGALYAAKVGMSGIDRSFYQVEDFNRLVILDNQLYSRSNSSFLGV